jgi:glycosyltransferase involved in cell wall biosynthesis
VGCDINPDCAHLSYEDPRIAVVVGDANSDIAQRQILSHAAAFDVIMDDGSHHSSDIVKSFARYFPHLADDGVFIAEDLHCSYWEEFEGGLYHPFASISFFKHLADVISHEHWGIARHRTDMLHGALSKHGSRIDEDTLQHVHSVEFLNSMCVIRKATPARNRLGTRVIAGAVGTVVPRHVLGSSLEGIPDQSDNEWSARSTPPGEEIVLRMKQLAERDSRLVILNQAFTERNAEIARLNTAILGYEQSTSWRVTKAFRFVGRQLRRIKRGVTLAAAVVVHPADVRTILTKVVRTYRRDGIRGVEARMNMLRADRHAGQMARYRGLSPELLDAMIASAAVLLRIKQWWASAEMRRRFADRALGVLRGETEASRRLRHSSIRVHIDKPYIGLINIIRDACVVAGWAVDLQAQAAAQVRIVVGGAVQDTHPKQREDVQRAFASVCELPLDTGFASALMLPVGVYRMRIEVQGGDGAWIAVRRALLLRVPGIRRLGQTPPRPSYSAGTPVEEKRVKSAIPEIQRHIRGMLHKPTFTAVVDTRHGDIGLEDTIQSIRGQLYPFLDVRLLSGAAATCLPDDVTTLTDMTLSDIAGDFIVFFQSGQRLASSALYEFAAGINQYPDIDLIYGDEDSVGGWGGPREPFHKPSWSPDYLETFNYIGFPACFRTAIARGCFANAHLYDMVLRFTERTTKVLHVPKILGHSVGKLRVETGPLVNGEALDIIALSGRLGRTGRRGSVYEHGLHKGCYGIRLDLNRSPLVSVVIPTAARTVRLRERRIDLIQNVIGQIRDRSTYTNVEIIVVDNGDLSPTQLRVLAEAGCRRITYAEPVFNVAKKLNLGVTAAKGELLLLMNDDIEILTPTWIERLLEHFEKPHVGVVGAKLLYPNGQTQHVGVVHNFGNPDHVRRNFPRDDAGYFFSTCGVRNYSAVTGACMMTRADLYREVGGYSQELAVNFNDVDYCMKVRRKGFSVVYTPTAELIHMESLSHAVTLDMGELAWYHQRWAAELVSDQFYNERFLTVEPPTFVPCVNQRLLTGEG